MLRWILINIAFLFVWFGAKAQQDIWAPDPPVLDSVSVDVSTINGNVFIGWKPSDSLDVKGYYIYTDSNAAGTTIWTLKDTVFGRLNTSYYDNNASAGYYSVGYRIAAFDSSNNVSLMTDPHYTIYAFPYEVDENCMVKIRLSWQQYIGWNNVLYYVIYRMSNDDGNFVIVDTVPGSATEYLDGDLQDGVNYCYYVRAVSNDGKTSSSNRPCFMVDVPNMPSYIDLANVSTIAENRIQLTILADPNTNGSNKINIYRKKFSESDNKYVKVKTITLEAGKGEYHVVDNANDKVLYRYKASVVNACGGEILTSNEASNVVISMETQDDLQFYLQWNAYNDWQGGIDSTYLFRQMDDYQPQVVKTEDFLFNDFFDDLSTYDFRGKFYEGNFCYYVEFKQKQPNQYSGEKYTSKSNKVCFREFSRVFMPNAFVPSLAIDTVNSIFKPSSLFIKKAGYYFAIYDRWGNLLFETHDPTKGWNGRDDYDNLYPSDYYFYLLIYTDNNGEVHKKSGRFVAID
jgi:gliding motility-associated-like protein